MNFLLACNQVVCALSSHTPAPMVIADFLKNNAKALNTECNKCGTPIELRKNSAKPNSVYVAELRFLNS